MTSQQGKYIVLGLASIILLVLGYFYFNYNPAQTGFYFPPCPFYSLTGLYCPGCGSQRAVHQLLHLDILAAAQYNPLLVLFVPLLLYRLFGYFLEVFSTKRIPNFWTSARFSKILLISILTFWILRNIPYFPFTYLAPS